MINTYPGSFYAVSSSDAFGFSTKASILSENFSLTNVITTLKWNLYPLLLSIVYFLTFPNIYVGSIFTILIWSISFFVIYDTLKKLELSKLSTLLALTFYSCFPSLIIFSSITLRDVFILLFINITLNFFVRLYYYKKYFKYLVIIFFQALLVFLMHKNFIILFYMMLPIFYFIIFTLINFYNKRFQMWYLYLCLFVVFIFFNIDLLINLSPFYDMLNGFQTGGVGNTLKGRTTYVQEVFYITNLYDLLYYTIVSFYNYMFSPFIFNLNEIKIYDFIVIFENLFRFIIIFLILFKLRYLNNTDKYFTVLFLIIFFSIEFSWALGTFSWGTAIRHHLTSIGVLTILLAYLTDIIRKKNDKHH